MEEVLQKSTQGQQRVEAAERRTQDTAGQCIERPDSGTDVADAVTDESERNTPHASKCWGSRTCIVMEGTWSTDPIDRQLLHM